MAEESLALRERYRKTPIKKYLAAQRKIDFIQSMSPDDYKGLEKGDEYKSYWHKVLRFAPRDIDAFLKWDVRKVVKNIRLDVALRLDNLHDTLGRVNWGDSYDIDEDEKREEKEMNQREY